MSQIYNLKTVASQTSTSVAEGKSEVQLLRLTIRQQEHHVQLQAQLCTQMIRIQLENQQLEMKLNQLNSQETCKEPAAKQPVQKQPLQLNKQECNRTPQLTHCHQKLKQDHEPYNHLVQPKGDKICNTEESVQPLQQHYDNQRTPLKPYQLNQSNSYASFTTNPKSRHSSENLLKNPEWSLTTSAPAPSTSPSIFPFKPPSHPPFCLRSSAAVQGKKGKTVTINPRKSGTGAASPTSQGVKGLCPSAASSSLPDLEEKGKKRCPTVEETDVIGGYQILEKSCFAKGCGAQKIVNVRFDELQLEQVFEYPSESSLLAFLPPPALPGPETEERHDEEDDEDDKEEKAVFLLSSRTLMPGSGRVLGVGMFS